MKVSPMYIDGEWVAGSGAVVRVVNPASMEEVGAIAAADAAQVDQALLAARRAFGRWSKLAPAERARALKKVAALVTVRERDLAALMTAEQGKPLAEALGEIRKLARTFEYYAEEATRVHGEIIPNESTEYQSFVVREPVGVVAAISPWNYPAELIGWKVAAGMAAGCTLVVKPPELTPLCPLEIARCVHDAGVPAGVLNMLTGSGPDVGRRMVESPQPDKIAFTGSSAVGLKIQQSCTNVKRLALELGGNCPMIVTASADLGDAVRGAARRAFRNMGQICISVNRIYVARSVYEPFLAELAKAADALVIGNGLDNPDADLGAMAAAEPLAKTVEHLDDAIAKGARLLAGGSRPQGEQFARGFFFRPTVLADCTHAMKVMTEETFGPLVGAAPYDDLGEAVRLANDSQYGLASYVFTKNLDEMRMLSRDLDFGNVAVNSVDASIINAPYGGRKQSGVGCEHGREGLLEYLSFKHVRIRYSETEPAATLQ